VSFLAELLYELILQPIGEWVGERKSQSALLALAAVAYLVAAYVFGGWPFLD